ncbi:hypothetical protein [Mycoplasma sp. VS31B]
MHYTSNWESPFTWIALFLGFVILIKGFLFQGFIDNIIRMYFLPLNAKRHEIKLKIPTICNIKKYNEGYQLVLCAIKQKIKLVIIFDAILFTIYLPFQSLSFTFALQDGYFTFLNVFIWVAATVFFSDWAGILNMRRLTKVDISEQILVEGTNLIEEFSYKNNYEDYDKFKFVLKTYLPNADFSKGGIYVYKIRFNKKFWSRKGFDDEEIEKIFYFIFSMSYQLENFLINPAESLEKIKYVYHNLKDLNSNKIRNNF